MSGRSNGRRSGGETRPLGVTILCLAVGAFPVVTILLVPPIFVESPPLAFGALLFSIAQLVLVYGLWDLRPWAWIWCVVVLACNAALGVLTADTLLAATISLLLLLYLWSVRPHYRVARGDAPV